MASLVACLLPISFGARVGGEFACQVKHGEKLPQAGDVRSHSSRRGFNARDLKTTVLAITRRSSLRNDRLVSWPSWLRR